MTKWYKACLARGLLPGTRQMNHSCPKLGDVRAIGAY